MTKLNFSVKNIQLFLFYLLPLFAISGPFLPDLTVIILSITFLYKSLKERRYYFYKSFFSKIFLLWYLIILASSILSSEPLYSLESSLFYFRFGLFALAVWQIIEDNENALQNFTYFILLSFVLLIVDGYFQFFTGNNFFGSPYIYGERLSSLFGDEYILGKYLAFTFPLAFALITRLRFFQFYLLILIILLLVLTDILIYITGERSAFALLILSTGSIIALTQKWKLIRAITFLFSIFIIILISYTNESIYKRMIDHTLKQTNVISTDSADNNDVAIKDNDLIQKDGGLIAFSDHHHVMYSTALKMFKDNPALGVGPKMYRKLCHEPRYILDDKLSCSTHPHNYYIQLLAETGIIGTLPIIIIFTYIVFNLLKHFSNVLFRKKIIMTDYRICLFICILVSLWPIVPSGNFFNNWLSFLMFLPVGFILYDKKINKI